MKNDNRSWRNRLLAKLATIIDYALYYACAFESRKKFMIWAWDNGYWECPNESLEVYSEYVDYCRTGRSAGRKLLAEKGE